METKQKLPFLTLTLLISFASVNAVLFTPALPNIAAFFAISDSLAQYTVSWFLIGYTLAQLLYGPLANRFGRKPTLYIGILLQIVASLGCVVSGWLEAYSLLIVSRFFLALGSGVGLKMTFTLVNECYAPKVASQKISYLMLAFAITPGLGVALGGLCNRYFGWMSCFMLGGIYGFLLLILVFKLPKVENQLDYTALQFSHLRKAFAAQFRHRALVAGALLMGCSTCFIYLFASLAPFIAMNILGLESEEYGLCNIIPAVGLVSGSLLSAQLIKHYTLASLIKTGIGISFLGVLLMGIAVKLSWSVLFALFLPMAVIEMGLSFILANASSLAMSQVTDKAHGSAVMNFINMGFATITLLSMGYFPTQAMLLPVIFLMLCFLMIPLQFFLTKNERDYVGSP